jgi:hypothetical protein
MKYRKKFLLDNAISNYLRDIFFEIGKKNCFDFDVIKTENHHLFSFVALTKIFSFKSDTIHKESHQEKSFKNTMKLGKIIV